MTKDSAATAQIYANQTVCNWSFKNQSSQAGRCQTTIVTFTAHLEDKRSTFPSLALHSGSTGALPFITTVLTTSSRAQVANIK